MKRGRFLTACLIAGYAFLYIPVLLLVATSFNPSRLTTVLSGFSLRWYAALWQDDKLIEAAGLSLRVAALSATGATVLGTLAGLALARFGRFAGRGAFAALLSARLVLPDVLVGLSLLLLFVQMEQTLGWPEGRGALTITLAHVSVSLSYVAVVIEARLADAGTELEDAAMDLGASPLKAFFLVTLPLLAPALLSGWLLAFTLSLDDLVVATFVSGPGATTLPMVVFSALRLGVTPELNALATVILLVVSLALGGAWWMQARVGRARSHPV
jgi:putrescine transport system permease protein